MRIEVGPIKSTIITDNPKLLSDLIKVYTFTIPGARYSSAYGKFWDGKKSFITPKGTFHTGLLDNILGTLNKSKCQPEIKFNYSTSKEIDIQEFDTFKLFEHQESIIIDALVAGRGIIKSPTGSGKTLILATLINSLLKETNKMVILINEKQLAVQTYEYLKSLNIPSLGICFGGNYIYGDIMICTIHSIDKILDTHLDCGALFVDEIHQFANGKVSLAAINSFPKAYYRFGFTATVPTDKIRLYNLLGAFGPIITSDKTIDLIKKNILVKPIIQISVIDYPMEIEEENTLEYFDFYDKYIVNNNTRNNKIKSIVELIKTKNPKAKILILVKNLEHGKILEKLIDNNTFLQGKDELSERKKVIKNFIESKDPVVITGTKILQTGINIPQITHYINAACYKSEIETLQALGRAIRIHDNKDKVFVYDFVDNTTYLRSHSNKRIKYYKKEGYEIITLPSIKYEDSR